MNQYEYECVCGYIWIDSERQPCPMCGESAQITAEPYESSTDFDRGHYENHLVD